MIDLKIELLVININITNDFRHFRFFFGPVNKSASIPIFLSEKPPHWNLETTDSYVH